MRVIDLMTRRGLKKKDRGNAVLVALRRHPFFKFLFLVSLPQPGRMRWARMGCIDKYGRDTCDGGLLRPPSPARLETT